MKKSILILCLLFSIFQCYSQGSVGIGTISPDPAAALEIEYLFLERKE